MKRNRLRDVIAVVKGADFKEPAAAELCNKPSVKTACSLMKSVVAARLGRGHRLLLCSSLRGFQMNCTKTGLAKVEDNVGYFGYLVRDSSRLVLTEPWAHYLHYQS
jgi:hypothetical protein